MIDVAPSTHGPVAKRPRRQVAKPTAAAEKVKTAVHLSPQAMQRLGIACVMEGKSQSELVEALILGGTKQYVVQVRGERGGEPGTMEDRRD